MNETDFRIRCERIYVIIILNFIRFFKMTDLNNRIYIISIKCINFTESVISSIIVIAEINILHK